MVMKHQTGSVPCYPALPLGQGPGQGNIPASWSPVQVCSTNSSGWKNRDFCSLFQLLLTSLLFKESKRK